MKPSEIKANREMRAFLDFVRQAELLTNSVAVSRPPPEPDILCELRGEGLIAFELVELCDEQIAKATAQAIKTGKNSGLIWAADPTEAALNKKLGKTYETEHPIELLCYTDARLVSPDDLVLSNLAHALSARGSGWFRRIWFLGEGTCELVAGPPLQRRNAAKAP